jgi:hypothetical protein
VIEGMPWLLLGVLGFPICGLRGRCNLSWIHSPWISVIIFVLKVWVGGGQALHQAALTVYSLCNIFVLPGCVGGGQALHQTALTVYSSSLASKIAGWCDPEQNRLTQVMVLPRH